MTATSVVHWPGKDTNACPDHLQKLVALGAMFGIIVSFSPVIEEVECDNCANEAKKAERSR